MRRLCRDGKPPGSAQRMCASGLQRRLPTRQKTAWIKQVRHPGPEERCKALSAFVNWNTDILAFVRVLPTRVSHGSVEGTKNRTTTIMRQGDGDRHVLHLRFRIVMEPGG